MSSIYSNFLKHLLNFFFPKICIVCKNDLPVEGKLWLCEKCLNDMVFIDGLFCKKCGKPLPDGGAHCYYCRNVKYYFESIRACCLYDGVIKECIHHFKFSGKDYLAKMLGKIMADRIVPMKDIEIDFIIPVPLHKKSRKKRGYNQSELLAKEIGKWLGKPVIIDNLMKIKITKPQFSLKREERLKNLDGAFSIRGADRIKEKNILIIDDVCTTSTTINECAKVLKKAGAKSIWGFVLAHG